MKNHYFQAICATRSSYRSHGLIVSELFLSKALNAINKRLICCIIAVGLLTGFNNLHAQTYAFTKPQGYGSATTGGGNASPVTVTTQSALQSAMTASGNAVILVSGTINCTYMSVLVTNKTVIGLPGARLRNVVQTAGGSGIINLKTGSSNVIFRNLIFEGPGAYDADGIDNFCITSGSNVWVDHCEFQDGMDGNFDIKTLSDRITVTWCKFTYLKPAKAGGSGGTDDHRFSNLVGSNDDDMPADGKFSVTYQYCWWAQGCVERMTRARNAQLDFVNCYWNSTVAKVALGLGGVTDCYVQNSVFANSGDKYRYYNNGTVRLTTVGSTAPPANVGVCPAPTYTREVSAVSSVISALTGTCGAGATLRVTSTGAISSACGPMATNSADETFSAVYPNPSFDGFTVKVPEGIKSLSVLNIYGEEVINLKNIAADQQVEIGKELTEGTYILLIKNQSDEIKSAKIVKVK